MDICMWFKVDSYCVDTIAIVIVFTIKGSVNIKGTEHNSKSKYNNIIDHIMDMENIDSEPLLLTDVIKK